MATVSTQTVSPQPRWRRWLRRLIVVLAIPYLSIAALLALFQRSLIYVPTRARSLPPSLAIIPGVRAEGVVVPTEDGLALNGWWLTAKPESAPRDGLKNHTNAGQRPLVLYFCGNAGHRGYRLAEFAILTAAGADVLCCDYRGYGDNPGSPSEEGLAADAQGVWKFATSVRGLPPERIVLVGESLGGGVAVRLAEELCRGGTPPGGLLVRSTFSSLEDVAANHYPWLPVRWLLSERFPSDSRIGQVICPIVVIHGVRDTIVPHRFGRALFAAAPDQSAGGIPKAMVDLPNADHNDVLETDQAAFCKAVADFLRQVVPSAGAQTPEAGNAAADDAASGNR